ncbi:PQQ-binding-like beta-propeller repeat protein [Streptomyces sp. PmtG]
MTLRSGDPESIGGYTLERRLGSGGMGTVYLARSASGRRLALKVVHQQFADSDEFRVRFRREVAAARRVSGAFTAPVVDADPEATHPWMATRYVPGPTLAERVTAEGPLRGGELRRLAVDLAEALRDIHRAGVVHRDLKPANIVLSGDGPRVIDFGVSRAADHTTLTVTGQVLGTPPFMSPEQLAAPRDVGPESDVFSLAAVLVYAACGRGPFDAETPHLCLHRVLSEPPRMDGVPAALRAALKPCLAKPRGERPTLEQLLARLRELPDTDTDTDTDTVDDDVAEPDAPVPPPGPRWRRARVAVTVALVLAVMAAATAVVLELRPDPRRDRGATVLTGDAPRGWRPWRVRPAGDSMFGGDLLCSVRGDSLYCGGDGRLTRIALADGTVRWPRRNDAATSGDRLLGLTGRTVVGSLSARGRDGTELVGLDAKDGTRRWTAPERTLATSAVAGATVLSSFEEGDFLQARDADTGKRTWRFRPPGEDRGCEPHAAGARLYALCYRTDGPGAPSATVHALDGEGRSTWRYPSRRPLAFLGADGRSPVFATMTEDKGGADRYHSVVRLDAATHKPLRFTLDKPYSGSEIAVTGGALYVMRSDGWLHAYSLTTAEKRWTRQVNHDQLSSPVAAGDLLLASTPIGQVVARDRRTGQERWVTRRHADDGGDATRGQSRVHTVGRAVFVEGGGPTLFSFDGGRPPTL